MIDFIKIKKFVLDNIIYRKYQIKYLDHLEKVFKKNNSQNKNNLILLELYPSEFYNFIYLSYFCIE